MKKIATILILLMSFLANAQTYNVTFQVNMINEASIAPSICVAGNFQAAAGYVADWVPGVTLLTDSNQDSIYSITLQIPPGSYEFKYLNGIAWGTDESVPGACAVAGNRGLTLTSDTILDAVCFGTCTVCDCNPSYSSDVVSSCGSFTWIDGLTYTSSNNTARDTLINTVGCDSIVALDLTISPLPNTSVTQNGATLEADELGIIYQWLDCDNNYAVINGETNQVFIPSITGNYGVEVTLNGCMDTSACYLVDYTGIEALIQDKKEIVKIVDLMGRETEYKPNLPLVFIYSDGTRERLMQLKEY